MSLWLLNKPVRVNYDSAWAPFPEVLKEALSQTNLQGLKHLVYKAF